MKKTTKKKPLKKPKTVSQLKKKADAIFSQYIRQKYSDPHTGLVACVTCGASRLVAEMQAGHYISRGNNPLRFDERNVFPQDVACNIFKKGNYPAYSLFLVRNFGEGILLELEEASKAEKQWKTFELQEIIDKYSL